MLTHLKSGCFTNPDLSATLGLSVYRVLPWIHPRDLTQPLKNDSWKTTFFFERHVARQNHAVVGVDIVVYPTSCGETNSDSEMWMMLGASLHCQQKLAILKYHFELRDWRFVIDHSAGPKIKIPKLFGASHRSKKYGVMVRKKSDVSFCKSPLLKVTIARPKRGGLGCDTTVTFQRGTSSGRNIHHNLRKGWMFQRVTVVDVYDI